MRKASAPRKNVGIGAIIVLILLAVCVTFQMQAFFKAQKTPSITELPTQKYTETLNIVMDYNYEPYSFESEEGIYLGHDVELAYALGKKMKTNVNIQFKSWAVARQAVENGEADILMGLEYNDAEKQIFDLSVPLNEDKFVAFGKENIHTISELYGAKFAIIESNLSYGNVLNTYNLAETTQTFPTYIEAFEAVQRGESDYVIARYSVGQRARAAVGDKSIKPTEMNLANIHMTLGVKKGDVALKNRLNVAITELAKDGTLERLNEKWAGNYVKAISFAEFFMENKNSFMITILVEGVVVIAIILTVYRMMLMTTRKQRKIMLKELEHEKLFAEATKSLYENIYEVDITRNCAGNKRTERYFRSMVNSSSVASEEIRYDVAIKEIAKAQIKREYVNEYIETFSPQNILEAYGNGFEQLSYDFMIKENGLNYHWVRIQGRLFFWKGDNSLRMIIYRQNIDNEKRQELELLERVKRDPMTTLYNKATTEAMIAKAMEQDFDKNTSSAFLIIDIDNFKYANDHFGHAFGDYLIRNFAAFLKQQFSEMEIVGRIGGDEFAVYMENIPNEGWLRKRVEGLIAGLNTNIELEVREYKATASIGIAVRTEGINDFQSLYKNADSALYQTKKRGKNGYTIFH